MSTSPVKREEEYQGTIWKHPYMVYILLTIVLFIILIGIAALALKNGWIPNRGTVQ